MLRAYHSLKKYQLTMLRIAWVSIYIAVLIWSGIAPVDRFTWLLEIFPALIGVAVLATTYKTFPLTKLVYNLILLHCIILMIGGHYTYAEVPFFNDLKICFGFERNNYDKVGHFAQGFVPALIAREIIIRKQIIPQANWRNFFILCFCLAFSALYELIEWLVAISTGEAAEAFLGTQGYVWDTQSDMALALVGAILALLLLGKWHDSQLCRIAKNRLE
jgi:putative membrane protein